MRNRDSMQAVVWRAPSVLERVTMPKSTLGGASDVIVRVECASTCGTDLHIYRGAIPGFRPGTVPGHEFTGVVESVDAEVTRFAPGQRVRSCDFAACGRCTQCATGRYAQCSQRMLFGFSGIQPQLDGALAEYVSVPWADTVLDPLPASVDARAGLLAADVLPTALGALERCNLSTHTRLAIVGAGPVGLLIALLAIERGCQAMVLEADPQRAVHARAAGVETLEVPGELTFAEAFPVLVGVADVVVDAVGGERGLAAAFALSLRATLADDMRSCEPHLDAMFSDHISLDQVPQYFSRLQERAAFKAVVHIGDGGRHR